MSDETFEIQVPQGTIVKVAGCPVKLKETLFIKQLTDNEFEIDDHEVMDYDYFDNGECE
jgi:hypothetical protein